MWHSPKRIANKGDVGDSFALSGKACNSVQNQGCHSGATYVNLDVGDQDEKQAFNQKYVALSEKLRIM